MTADEIHELRAKREFEAIAGFYKHFMIYAAVCLILIAVDVLGGDPMWSHWVVLGWGIGIVFHARCAFTKIPQQMAKWEADHMAKLKPA